MKMTLKKAYCYLFYKFYKLFETSPFKWSSEWKTSFCISILEAMLVMTFDGYYTIVTKKEVFSGNPLPMAIVLIAVVYGFNYYVFHHNDRWREYVKEFNKWSKKKNSIGSLIALLVVLLIITNLIFVYYLMSQIDWSKYR